MIWDRRASSRGAASQMYLEAIDQEDLPWGAALKLNKVIKADKGNAHIRSLRYYREQRGMLAVLSSSGQLQVLRVNKEFVEPNSFNDIRGTPEFLEVRRSYDLEYPYFDQDRKIRFEDRIVSFDWLTLGTSELTPRLVALRANGNFEILQTPTSTVGHLSKFIPWQPPHRRRF